MKDIDPISISVLDAIERREAELLSWGIVDGGFPKEELEDLVDGVLYEKESLRSPEDVIDELEEHKLLFGFSNRRGERRWRSRMAEAVRLFSRLRQLTPWRDWREAPALVSDFRFDIKPRLYPKRNWPLDEDELEDDSDDPTVLGRVTEEVHLQDLQKRVFRDLVHPVDPDTGEREKYELSEFQVEATRRALSDVKTAKSRGMIVCAGTGTGKTLAFYLPAFSRVARKVRKDDHWTKVLALYPRRELLKDQLSDAYENARRLDDTMLDAGKRKITVGAYYGDTPKRAKSVLQHDDLWPQDPNGRDYLCPYLQCPRCESALRWNREDIERGIERLECTGRNCPHVVEENEVRLTRQSILEDRPDFLFTTTEMMNRLMSNHHHSQVIGVGTSDPAPEMVLLDEVHTYSGTHGAQVAHLLRRWHRAVKDRGRPQYTGLSATLRSAREFFATLTDLNPARVEKIAPREETLTESESIEYQLALRGDPVSGTALLSTSIQALMLLRRILDPVEESLDEGASQGIYGQRAFAFTDNLDVINRFYHNFLDAEGRHPRGWQKKKSLASLRSQYRDEEADRFRWGQSWRLAEEIGHPKGLQKSLEVDRTSSQDAGVTQKSDVVIATASLEVGYNDARVGGILQHKAPRDMASFLQRKGRAGRPPRMRPWTVVVLSDYGRDRMAYQGYDQLFSPVIEERTLPVSNRFVLRMQAVYATMDWLAREARQSGLPAGRLWRDLSTPVSKEKHDGYRENREIRREWLADKIEAVLDGGADYHALRTYVGKALGIEGTSDLHTVFWNPPRPLMTAVLPTALRRLETDWATLADGEDYETHDQGHPLPEFIPDALFGDLNLPEVNIDVPIEDEEKGEEKMESHTMPVAQAMREYAPGRVSRRFGIHSDADTHWIAPPSLDSSRRRQDLEVRSFCKAISGGTVQVEGDDGNPVDYPCLRPTTYAGSQVGESVRNSSNAFLDWRTQICPFTEGETEPVSEAIHWHEIVPEVAFYTHRDQSPLEIRRFALASDAEIGFKDDRQDLNARIRFVQDGAPVALGFTQEVDGVSFRVKVPDRFDVDLSDPESRQARALRTAYYEHRLQASEALDELANEFQRGWIYQLSLAALSNRAAFDSSSLDTAFKKVGEEGIGEAMIDVLERIFKSLPDEADSESREDHIKEELRSLCVHPTVEQVVAEELPVLWRPADREEDWQDWLERRFLSSLGNALLEACTLLCPEFEGSELLLDIDTGPRPPGAGETPDDVEEIWITERTLGGGGVINQIRREYRKDPRRFYQLVENALSASDLELVDAELQTVLDLATSDDKVKSALKSVRHARGVDDLQDANADLRDTLTSRGMLGIHPVYAGLQNRLLRPGSSAQTDRLLHMLIRDWQATERRLGIEVDARVFAYTASREEKYAEALASVDSDAASDAEWRFQTIYSLLWPRGRKVREKEMDAYNPFSDLPPGDRLLVAEHLPQRRPPVDIDGDGWKGRVTERLSDHGLARLSAEESGRPGLQSALVALLSEPVDVDFLRLYPQLSGVEREEDGFVATIVLPEVTQ